MAAKKVGRPLKKKPQKKHQLARQKQRLPARKLKKPRTLLGRKTRQVPKARVVKNSKAKVEKKSKAKVEKNEELQFRSTRLFVSEMLSQMPKVRMAAKARGMVKTLMTDLYSYMANEVKNMSQQNELSSISLNDLQTFLKQAMEREVANLAASNTPTADADADDTDDTVDISMAPDDSTTNAAPNASASAPTLTA